jgi:hypothetical protein
MGQYQSYTPSAWDRSLQTTLANHTKEVEDATWRNYILPGMIKERGNVVLNVSGAGMTRPIQFDIHDVRDTLGEDPLSPTRKNLWQRAEFEMRGYDVTDAIKKKEMLENRSKHAIINVYKQFVKQLGDSMDKHLATRYVVDGSTAANSKGWEGLGTLFQASGDTLNVSTGAARTANAADPIAEASGTYANLTMDLGSYGGAQDSSAVWPWGQADVKYDFWTPLLVNATSTYFSGSTWAANGVEALRLALAHSQRNDARSSAGIDLFLMSRDWLYAFKNQLDTKERVIVSENLPARALGFKTISFDGVEIAQDTSMPAASAYGVSVANVSLECQFDQLLHSEGPHYEWLDKSYAASVETNSNLIYKSPANFCKLSAVA